MKMESAPVSGGPLDGVERPDIMRSEEDMNDRIPDIGMSKPGTGNSAKDDERPQDQEVPDYQENKDRYVGDIDPKTKLRNG